MQEQKRAAKSSAKGAKSIANKKWATVVSHAKARCAQETSGKKKVALQENKSQILDKLNKLNLPQTLVPTFYMPTQKHQVFWCKLIMAILLIKIKLFCHQLI